MNKPSLFTNDMKTTFAALFRKYRLRSEFETLSEFGGALADKGYAYDASIFSHWQNGTRVPKDRRLLLTMIEIFIERNGISSVAEANQFMESVGLGYLTSAEISRLPLENPRYAPFMAPRIPEFVIERGELVTHAARALREASIIVLQGMPGSGKTTIAAILASHLKDAYPDGVLWLNCQETSTIGILHTIAQAFGEVLPPDIPIRQAAELYRTIIRDKGALFVFDGASVDTDVLSILPNTSQSGVIFTAQHLPAMLPASTPLVHVGALNDHEAAEMLEQVLGRDYCAAHRSDLKTLSLLTGNAPLPLLLLSRQIASRTITLSSAIKELQESHEWLHDMTYGDKTLYSSLHMTVSRLRPEEKRTLEVCALFEGPFHVESIAYAANALPVRRILNRLARLHIVDQLDDEHAVLHRLVRVYMRRKQLQIAYWPRLAGWYTNYISRIQNGIDFFSRMSAEVQPVLTILNGCLTNEYADAACKLWQAFGGYYWHVGPWQDFSAYSQRMARLAARKNLTELQLSILLEDISRLYYYHGNVSQARLKAAEALTLAAAVRNTRLAALAHQRYGKLCFMTGRIDEGKRHLAQSWIMYTNLKDHAALSHNYRYISEGYLLEKDLKSARFLLEKSQEEIERVKNPSARVIYGSVIQAHFGVLAYIEGDYASARKHFEKGLSSDGCFPLVRGTYTWLNRFGLAMTYRKLGFSAESTKLSEETLEEMTRLGIEKSFAVINAYAWRLAEELRGDRPQEGDPCHKSINGSITAEEAI